MILIIGLLAGLLIDWRFRGIALVGILGLIMFFFALTFAPKVRNWRTRLIMSIPSIACLIVVAAQLPLLFPLETRIHGEEFHEVSLAKVLQYISQQRREWPLWQFDVYDEEAAGRYISVSIPDGVTLQQALDIVAGNIQCYYDWYWYKPVKSSACPMCAIFRLRQPGHTEAPSTLMLSVRGADVWRPGGNRSRPGGESGMWGVETGTQLVSAIREAVH